MNTELTKQFLEKLIDLAKRVNDTFSRPIQFMEVCGTHTTAISKSGLRGLLCPHIELLSGPGCPVCVTDQAEIDTMIALARIPNVTVATFGDMIRVPGTESTLEVERARGANVEIFYSPMDTVLYAQDHKDREVVFLGVGFETTAPAVAMSIVEARSKAVQNYSVFSVHKIVPPAMRALLADPELRLDGFILPGHVCTITGRRAFDFISSEYRLPAVVAGFGPMDVMESLYLLMQQMLQDKAETVIGYRRLVHENGNIRAQKVMEECFEIADTPWRGFGVIPGSGLRLKPAFRAHDASARFPIEIKESSPPEGCSCGEVLKGKMKPNQCPLFSTVCTPSDPIGPCMVSSEGACSAYYHYDVTA